MSTMPVSEARASLPAVIDEAATQSVTLERHGKAVAVVISPERYDELMDAWEELEDIAAFDEAIASDLPTIPWHVVKVDLGWS